MTKIGKISTVKLKSGGGMSKRDSLASAGLLRVPGAIMPLSPYKEPDGSYRTGLDPNARYIKNLPPEQQESERKLVQSLLEKAQKFYGEIDLGPRAPFYSEMFSKYGKSGVCKTYQMIDGDNLFNLDNPEKLITYAWLRRHPFVAPSGADLLTGKYSQCKFYVNDSDVETEVNFKVKTRIANAIQKLSGFNPTRLRQVARLCGFPVTVADTQENVFVHLYDFINDSASPTKSGNITLFENVTALSQEDMDTRDILEEAFIYGVFRNYKTSIYRSDTRVAANKEELFEILTDPKNQDDLLSIQQEVKVKRSQTHD